MPILNPEHLLDQADFLVARNPGRPRQVDLRRAISGAYYAVFHALITMAADEMVGAVHQGSREHGLAMRAIDHRTLKMVCLDLVKSSLPQSYPPYLPRGGFGDAMMNVLEGFPGLQEERHAADYDSLRAYSASDAKGVIAAARLVLDRLRATPAAERKALSYLFLFPPRR